MTPSYLHFIILFIFALPAILSLLLVLWGLILKGYSDFFVQDEQIKQKLKKYIEPTYENFPDSEFGAINPGYIFGGIVGFLVYGLPWGVYTFLTYFMLDYFSESYSGIFFTHITTIISILLFIFLLGAISELYELLYWKLNDFYWQLKCLWEDDILFFIEKQLKKYNK